MHARMEVDRICSVCSISLLFKLLCSLNVIPTSVKRSHIPGGSGTYSLQVYLVS